MLSNLTVRSNNRPDAKGTRRHGGKRPAQALQRLKLRCAICGEYHRAYRSNQRYCSPACRLAAFNARRRVALLAGVTAEHDRLAAELAAFRSGIRQSVVGAKGKRKPEVVRMVAALLSLNPQLQVRRF